MNQCAVCQAPASANDRYCGGCGAPLARLRWQIESADRGGADRVAVRRGVRTVRLSIANEGVVPAGLVLPAASLDALPSWVDSAALTRLRERALTLAPGHEQTLSLPLSATALERAFRGTREDDQDATIGFLTTLNQSTEGGWTPRPITLTLTLAREPWFEPGGSLYRFWHHTLRAGLEHELELHNESAAAIEVLGLDVMDGLPEDQPDRGGDRIGAREFAELLPSGDANVLQPGSRRKVVVRLRMAEPRSGWFALRVVLRYKHRAEGRVQAMLIGRIARAPCVHSEAPETIGHPGVEREETHRLRIRNPGELPVRIQGVQVLRRGEAAPARDFLVIKGLEAGELLAPGEERELSYRLQPRDRQADEFDTAWIARHIRIEHDGAHSPFEREIDVQLGRVQVPTGVYMGIDFGTTNSLVCLFRPDTRAALALPLDRASPQMPSLLFYEGSDARPFLFGSEADATANLNPTNLVRSIKSVIARDPDADYHFLERTPEGWRRRSYTPQQLLDLFIEELRRRAEKAVSELPARTLQSLRLSSKVRFDGAVFSHPVEVNAETRQALTDAAGRAGLQTELVDEATAAVLAYVYSRLDPASQVGRHHRLVPVERILCMDVGGGTTDVAAVEVRDLDGFLAMDVPKVTVQLEATSGDPLFGGDDLDQLVAAWIVDAVRVAAERQGSPIRQAELERAASFRSFAEYYNGYKARLGGGEQESLVQAHEVFNKAVEVLRKAEEAKIELSSRPRAELHFSGEGWPRRRRRQAEGVLEPLRVVIERERFEEQVRSLVKDRTRLFDQVVENAGWSWDSITTLLFTGQGTRVPVLREVVVNHLATRRGPEALPLVVVDPDSGFDPKQCVALGAAIWGTREDGEWIEVINRMQQQLTHDIQTRWGPFHFKTLPGLGRGTALPARAEHSFPRPRTSLELFRNGQLLAVFRFPETASVHIVVDGPGQLSIEVNGTLYRGELA